MKINIFTDNRKQLFVFPIIMLEGYAVLAIELLAIRQVLPFVGSGIEVVSIIVSAILLPLAVGYHFGGTRVKTLSIRKILLRNLTIAIIILIFGLSYIPLEIFFSALPKMGLHNRILQTVIYSAIFLITPTFLLAQTIPLVSNYLPKAKLSEITGRMLFFSTSGSFLGSIFSTLVLMTILGVHNTVNITITLIGLIVLILSRRLINFDNFIAVIFIGILWTINGNAAMGKIGIIADTPYSLMSIEKNNSEKSTILNVNRSLSSKYAANPQNRFEYIKYVENNFIPEKGKPIDILVLGAGGFTFGWDDQKNNYTFVDIEEQLKPIAEKYLLPGAIAKNKKAITTSARAFLRSTQEK
ncbi:MAG: hypothetical protein WCL30_06210, partial [Pseudomonadota bacterium]